MVWKLWGRTGVAAGLLLAALSVSRPAGAALPAPVLVAPAAGATIARTEATLSWQLPAGATQYHLQVVPVNGDGPGVDLIRNAEPSFTIPAAPTWYVLLPDMTYGWRIRTTDLRSAASGNDGGWGPWSESRVFRTAAASSDGLTPVSPRDGAHLESARPVALQWSHPDPSVFYFEIQVSRDHRFDTNATTATSFVWWLIRHGGATTPPNSWMLPVLEPDTTYYWRVRPRVQGDGVPVAWGPTWRFSTPRVPQIAFTSNREGNDEIYVLHADGTLPARLTVNPARDGDPAWSPDGRRIAFVSDREGNDEIYVMNTDGSGVTRLTHTPSREAQPAWSPDGGLIAFVSDRAGNAEIYLMHADGSGQTRLTENLTHDDHPVWALDGSSIAFVSDRDGNREIYLMRPDGSGPVNRTNSPATDFDPVWSPADGQLAFVSDRDGNNEIYIMQPDGRGVTRLTVNPASDTQPAYPSDGSSIAFVSDRDLNNEIFLMRPDGTGAVNRTSWPSNDHSPTWQR